MPLFSFIVPVYNVKPYLSECLDSILGQEFTDYEICIVDDGSSDGSENICDVYKKQYNDQIKLYHQPNQGVSSARNKALEMATGKYIWFVDADDYILPGALDYLSAIIKKSNCDTIFFGNKKFNGSESVYYKTGEREFFLRDHICYCNPLMIFIRSIIEMNSLRFTLGMKMGEDLEFQYKYLLHCQSPVSIDYNFYNIRYREGSASRSSTADLNDLKGNQILLENLYSYIFTFKHYSILWLKERIDERLKCYLQSASKIDSINWHDVQIEFNKLIRLYKEIGFHDIASGSLRIARLNVRLYAMLYKLNCRFKA